MCLYAAMHDKMSHTHSTICRLERIASDHISGLTQLRYSIVHAYLALPVRYDLLVPGVLLVVAQNLQAACQGHERAVDGNTLPAQRHDNSSSIKSSSSSSSISRGGTRGGSDGQSAVLSRAVGKKLWRASHHRRGHVPFIATSSSSCTAATDIASVMAP